MNEKKVFTFQVKTKTEEFGIKSHVQLYESDCFVFNNESYYVERREGNTLFAKPITKTIAVFL